MLHYVGVGRGRGGLFSRERLSPVIYSTLLAAASSSRQQQAAAGISRQQPSQQLEFLQWIAPALRLGHGRGDPAAAVALEERPCQVNEGIGGRVVQPRDLRRRGPKPPPPKRLRPSPAKPSLSKPPSPPKPATPSLSKPTPALSKPPPSNPSKSWFANQNQTMNPPNPSKIPNSKSMNWVCSKTRAH